MSLPVYSSSAPSYKQFHHYLGRLRPCSWRTLLPGLIFCALFFTLVDPIHVLPRFDSDLGHVHPPPPPPFKQELYPPRPPPPPPFQRPGDWDRPKGSTTTSSVWSGRAEQVKAAFVFAWEKYRQHAFPWDEITPLGPGKVNNFNGWGVTIYDSLDTIWIMELQDIWDDAMVVVANATFPQTENEYAPFFETVIRYLGGLLSAYSLSGEPILISRAETLGKGLLGALNTTTGLPWYAVNIQTGATKGGWTGDVLYSEALSCQMEYKYLAHATGRAEYYHAVENIMQVVLNSDVQDGVYPTRWSSLTGKPTTTEFSVGAFADSAHEYLLKQYLLSSRSEPRALDMYLKTVDAIIDTLLYITPKRKLLYVTDTMSGTPTHKFEHLSCFLPGLLALGAQTLELSKRDYERHSWAAQGLAYTCYLTYADQMTGLGPDEMTMAHDNESTEKHAGLWIDALANWEKNGRPGRIPPGLHEPSPAKGSDERDYYIRRDGWFLRPEVIEAIFYMWKTTGDAVWRERGWEIFESIEKHAKKENGYASLDAVNRLPPGIKNETPSYFYAETLKYLYLMFHEGDVIPLDKFVFNTEGHPLAMFEWRSWEKQAFGLN